MTKIRIYCAKTALNTGNFFIDLKNDIKRAFVVVYFNQKEIDKLADLIKSASSARLSLACQQETLQKEKNRNLHLQCRVLGAKGAKDECKNCTEQNCLKCSIYDWTSPCIYYSQCAGDINECVINKKHAELQSQVDDADRNYKAKVAQVYDGIDWICYKKRFGHKR